MLSIYYLSHGTNTEEECDHASGSFLVLSDCLTPIGVKHASVGVDAFRNMDHLESSIGSSIRTPTELLNDARVLDY